MNVAWSMSLRALLAVSFLLMSSASGSAMADDDGGKRIVLPGAEHAGRGSVEEALNVLSVATTAVSSSRFSAAISSLLSLAQAASNPNRPAAMIGTPKRCIPWFSLVGPQ